MIAGCLGEPVVQQVEHHVFGPRLPKAIEEIVTALVSSDFEHRSSSPRDAVLEIDGTFLACALGRCAHRNDSRGVVLPVPVEPLDAIAILQPCSELEAVALSELRTRQHLLGAVAGFASECHCADLVLDDTGGAGAGARGDTGAEGNLLTELERLLGVLLRRHTELVTADRAVDDDPGGLVLLEVFREHELELRTQPLRHRQASGRVDVARHEVEVFSANAHRIEPDELPGDPKHVA